MWSAEEAEVEHDREKKTAYNKVERAGNRELYFGGPRKSQYCTFGRKDVGMQTCLLCLHGDHLDEPFNSGIDEIR